MKSTTVKFNVFMLFTAIILASAVYVTKFEVNSLWWTVLIALNIVVSQTITFFSPSGEFIGHGQNWSTGKWIARVGTAVLAIGTALAGYGLATVVIAAITPLIEIIIRVYGSDTAEQRAAAASK